MELAKQAKLSQMSQLQQSHPAPTFPQLPQGMASLPFNLSQSPQLLSAPLGHQQPHFQQGQMNYASNPNPNFQASAFHGQLNAQQRAGQLPNPSFRVNPMSPNPFPADRR